MLTKNAIDRCRALGMRSINFDLIYGLPRQTLASFDATLDIVIALDPDRIALYSYAHLPASFPPQRRIAAADLPSPDVKLDILSLAIGRLTRAGYLYIGFDHFAKPDDELALAQSQGRLHRNFQGYSTRAEADLLGFGVSAIGKLGDMYYQNEKLLKDYESALDTGALPLARGFVLSRDDLLRREIIQQLACQFRVSIEAFEEAWLIRFERYFENEMKLLRVLEADGLVTIDREWIRVTSTGRMLVRVVCAVFDNYLRDLHPRDHQPGDGQDGGGFDQGGTAPRGAGSTGVRPTWSRII